MMQGIVLSADEIKARSAEIRLVPEALGRLAGLAPSTVHRVFSGADTLVSTLEKIGEALLAEELRMRDRLVRLHGLPAACRPPEAAQSSAP